MIMGSQPPQPEPEKKPSKHPTEVEGCTCCKAARAEDGEPEAVRVALSEHTINHDLEVLVCLRCDAIKV
jgi:hypothetical protein